MSASNPGGIAANTHTAWQPAGFRELGKLAAQLRTEEWKYVPLTSRLCAERWTQHAPGRPWYVLIDHGAGATATTSSSAVLVTESGLVLPALQPGSVLPAHFTRLLRGSRRAVYSVMGTADDVRQVEMAMARPPGAAVDYLLMTLDAATFRDPPATRHSLVMERGTPADTNRLFELQRGYEIEEVLLRPARFNPETCRRQLRETLKRDVVLYATYNGRPVAKAATNARGFAVDQIGGVYTTPELRGQGVAAVVMKALLELLFERQRSATLFVKLHNGAAIALYRKLGFLARDHYRISYYFD
jgi:predicted GNAT family acetyltransferase